MGFVITSSAECVLGVVLSERGCWGAGQQIYVHANVNAVIRGSVYMLILINKLTFLLLSSSVRCVRQKYGRIWRW